jgi:hypothetical protein
VIVSASTDPRAFGFLDFVILAGPFYLPDMGPVRVEAPLFPRQSNGREQDGNGEPLEALRVRKRCVTPWDPIRRVGLIC